MRGAGEGPPPAPVPAAHRMLQCAASLLQSNAPTARMHDKRHFNAQAFGPGGLGIIRVSGVPELKVLRGRLLPLAQRFAVRP